MTLIRKPFFQLGDKPDPICYFMVERLYLKSQIFETLVKGDNTIREVLLSKLRLLDGGEG